MKLMDIVYPAAQVMVDIAKSQDMEVGDGTTSGQFDCTSFNSMAFDKFDAKVSF